MIIFLNNFITKNTLSKYDRGLYSYDDPLLIYKWMLLSLSDLDLNKVIIRTSLDFEYYNKNDEKELINFCKNLFNEKLDFIPNRIETIEDWKFFLFEYLKEDESEIFYCGNHDHIYVAHSNNSIEACLSKMREFSINNLQSSITYSHWPEFYAEIYKAKIEGLIFDDGFAIPRIDFHSVRILTKKLFQDWINAYDGVHKKIRRTEELHSYALGQGRVPFWSIAPIEELFRHYDAYSHSGISISNCPPLKIPEGLFTNSFKLAFLNEFNETAVLEARGLGFTISSPCFEGNSSINPNFPDFNWSINTIPKHLMRAAKEIIVISSKNGEDNLDDFDDSIKHKILYKSLPVEKSTLQSIHTKLFKTVYKNEKIDKNIKSNSYINFREIRHPVNLYSKNNYIIFISDSLLKEFEPDLINTSENINPIVCVFSNLYTGDMGNFNFNDFQFLIKKFDLSMFHFSYKNYPEFNLALEEFQKLNINNIYLSIIDSKFALDNFMNNFTYNIFRLKIEDLEFNYKLPTIMHSDDLLFRKNLFEKIN
jgi:hypothetical protein